MILVPDVYKDREENIRSIKYVTIDNSSNIRLDRIDLKLENGKKILERMSHFGKSFGKFFDIDDFSYSKTDLDNNTIESVEASVTNGIYGTEHVPCPYNFIGIDGKTKDFGFINKAIYDITELNGYNIRNAKLENNVVLPELAYSFEDYFNIEFSNIIGNLSTVLTRSSLSIPFRANIILDSKYGINVKEVKEIFNDTELKEVLYTEFKSFIKSLNVIERSMRELYQKEKRHIRIYAAVREFDSMITINDIDYNMTYKFHLNNTDHARTLYTTISHLGSRWFDTEEFGNLVETKCVTIPAAMFEMGDELRRVAFEQTNYSDNFPLSYK